MAIRSEKSFRIAAIGGFNRQDVMDFIASSARERREEIEAYRTGAEKLRGERDKYSAALEAMSGVKERADGLSSANKALFAEKEQLRSALEDLRNKHASLQEENNSLRLRVDQYEAELDGFSDAKSKMAEIEMQAYRRAEAIEAEAAQNEAKVRASIMHTLAELTGRFKGVMTDSEASAYAIVTELDKMRDWFVHMPDLLDSLNAQLQAMSLENRPIIRDFIPEEFDGE
jgi:chromosome segregation ATPase